MSTLFLAWQNSPTAAQPKQRAWYPIGRLDQQCSAYRFSYTHGVERAQKEAGFSPLLAFPDLRQTYMAKSLFPLFRNRVINDRRADLSDHLARMGLGPDERDPIKILAISGGERQTDHLEVFPKIEVAPDGSFACRFFAHGVRHLDPTFRARIDRMEAGEQLRVTVEMDNPVTGAAIQLQTREDYHLVGWAPRYLIQDILTAMAKQPQLSAKVVRLNPLPAPPNQRLLIELSGRFPEHCEPMGGLDFQPLT